MREANEIGMRKTTKRMTLEDWLFAAYLL